MKGRSTLFLIELLMVIAVFAICAAVCVYILVSSYLMMTNAVDTKNALLAVESAAETVKAYKGSDGAMLDRYFDSNWQASSQANATFIMTFVSREHTAPIRFYDISLCRLASGEELVSLSLAVRAS